ncbi:hypothetical protein BT96DRAFT_912382 [Gymnopus androsaceus JB14]|uniref:Uncharacterized protein n=1 Tax=Gymnopus androsaceus JB14 TaxID=1447944 RepID=A0A6A4IMH2_9AGAR|nr:hypothetical protein BT96DRAFT_912382 [Gymnopus androsaceus JB14]
MPTSTQPFEILFDLTNDTAGDVVFVPYSSGNTASSILLGRGRSISLVLDAGSMYHYTLKSSKQSWQISVKSWQDIRCTVSSVLLQSVPWTLSGGITCRSRET